MPSTLCVNNTEQFIEPTRPLYDIDNITVFATELLQFQEYIKKNKIISIEGISESSVYVKKENVTNPTSRKCLIESFTQPSRNSFLKQKLEEVQKIYSLLEYENLAVLEISADIIKDCLSQNKRDIKISRTGENEILIFSENNGTYNNIIIDEDGDIEFLHIPINRDETYNEHFPFIGDINTYNLVSKL